jgi:hypothetical protein
MVESDPWESGDEQDREDYREEALRRARRGERVNVEAYFAASLGPPRWAERLQDLEGEERALTSRLRDAWIELAGQTPDDPTFAREWMTRVRAARLDVINTLVDQHNQFFPVERHLPWDFRLGDYRAPWGIEWRRRRRDAAWLLDAFPADRSAAVSARAEPRHDPPAWSEGR